MTASLRGAACWGANMLLGAALVCVGFAFAQRSPPPSAACTEGEAAGPGLTAAPPQPVGLPALPFALAPPEVKVAQGPALAPATLPAPLSAGSVLKARKRSLSQLPDGVVARLRRTNHQHRGDIARLLAAGARALERGASWTALKNYLGALELAPRDEDALVGVALCRYELGQWQIARRVLNRVLARDPSHPEAFILRGFIAQLAGEPTTAIDWYERALIRVGDAALEEELRSVVASLRQESPAIRGATARAEVAAP